MKVAGFGQFIFWEGGSLYIGSSVAPSELHIGLIEDRPTLTALTNSSGQEIISVSGYGSTRPIPGVPEDNDAQRRIDLRFVMEAEDQQNLVQVQSAADQMKKELEDLSNAVKLARSETSAQ